MNLDKIWIVGVLDKGSFNTDTGMKAERTEEREVRNEASESGQHIGEFKDHSNVVRSPKILGKKTLYYRKISHSDL